MAKKNLKGFQKLLQDPPNNNATDAASASKRDPQASHHKGKGCHDVTEGSGNNAHDEESSGGLMKRTLSVELGVKWEQPDGVSKRVESVVKLTFPQW